MQHNSGQTMQTRQSTNATPETPGSASDMMGGGAVVVNLSPSERETIIKQNGFRTGVDVTRKLNEIKNERKGLRTQLDQFQKNFEETHKRKIRYTKDIVPV